MIFIYPPTNGARSISESFCEFLAKKKEKYYVVHDICDLRQIELIDTDRILCGIPVDDYEKNYEVIRFLSGKTDKFFFFMDHWHNSPLNFFDVSNQKKYFPKKIFCIDQYMKIKFIDGGIDEKIIEVLGHASLEKTFRTKFNSEKVSRLKKEKAFDREIAVLFLDPIGKRKKIIGYDEIEVVNHVIRGLKNSQKDLLLIIKPHPRTDDSVISSLVAHYKNVKVLDQSLDIDAFDLINMADKVLGMTSIMLVHSLVLNKPTLSIQINASPIEGRERSNIYLDEILCSKADDISDFFDSDKWETNILPKDIYFNSCEKIFQALGI